MHLRVGKLKAASLPGDEKGFPKLLSLYLDTISKENFCANGVQNQYTFLGYKSPEVSLKLGEPSSISHSLFKTRNRQGFVTLPPTWVLDQTPLRSTRRHQLHRGGLLPTVSDVAPSVFDISNKLWSIRSHRWGCHFEWGKFCSYKHTEFSPHMP